jgi:two-component sensor histidine kinase
LANSFGYDLAHVQTNVKLSTNRMSIDKAIPIGLIINELVTNAFKHAFTNTIHPLVTIELQMIKQHTLQLKVSDNGVGMPNMADMEKNTSFGMRMVQTLVQQLDAQLNFSSHNGTQFVIEMNNI